ncbi:MAG: peptidylprolyl isomerase [Spirochaetaceae bacterium]|nr:peptidylprolyl isomerase [Spirochaetaceae bacterium]
MIKKGKVVSLFYSAKDEAGNLVDSADENSPIEYIQGSDSILPALEAALEGKNEGDTFTVYLEAKDAYGESDENLFFDAPLEHFDGEVRPGMRFFAQFPDGEQLVTVVSVENGNVKIDANHPLAGKNLTFTVTVCGVRNATTAELEAGSPEKPASSCSSSSCGGCCGGCGGSCG